MANKVNYLSKHMIWSSCVDIYICMEFVCRYLHMYACWYALSTHFIHSKQGIKMRKIHYL